MFATNTSYRPIGFGLIFLREVGSDRSDAAGDTSTPIVYTIVEACQVLKISRWTVYELIRSRQLATITIGKRRLIPALAIHALVEKLSDEDSL